MTKRSIRWTEEELATLADLFRQGKRDEAIAKEMGRGVHSIKSHRLALGLNFTKTKGATARDTIVRLFHEGLSDEEIARRADRTVATVLAVRQRLGLWRNRPWTDDEVSRLVDMHNAGKSPRELATELRRSYAAIVCQIKECGLRPNRAQRRNALELQIKSLMADGLNSTEIAARLGRGLDNVTKLKKEFGLYEEKKLPTGTGWPEGLPQSAVDILECLLTVGPMTSAEIESTLKLRKNRSQDPLRRLRRDRLILRTATMARRQHHYIVSPVAAARRLERSAS